MSALESKSRIPERISKRLRLPVIAAPMLAVSGPELVIAACKAGVVGAFPVANARTIETLDKWMTEIKRALDESAGSYPNRAPAPFCPNLIIRRPDLREHLACVVKHRVEMVITSVGSPEAVIGPLHDTGCLVFADVATVRHAEKAIAVGVDGLILLTAGAGGNTGWLNPLAFVRAVRGMFDGPIVLAGGISDGHALWAARVMGCDLAYMGTKFIATRESMASDAYREMLVKSEMDDIMLSTAFTGLQANMLRPSIVAAGLDPDNLPSNISIDEANTRHGAGAAGPRRWRDIWSAGHSVSGVKSIQSVAEMVAQTEREYASAMEETARILAR
ncbi:MAG TPA: nitronate monooxygenase [Candidatus Binataceae bacterium]|nr:nitronate monooxygenase [Candidatus Binataceae bacterium]